MTIDFVSLAVICLVSAAVPVLAQLVPKKLIPETVFLLFIGALLGPNTFGLIHTGETITFLSDLGLAFLFLLAGFEINPKSLGGRKGGHALGCWLVSFSIALGLVFVAGIGCANPLQGLAVAIALTSTALGTLMPILKERGLMGSAVGDTIITYGTWGELGPVLAMALLLSARSAWKSTIILLLMGLVCVLIALFSKGFREHATRLYGFITAGSESSQTYVRLTVLLLVLLIALSSLFDIDIVLGSFAAGFLLRYIVPKDNEDLEPKINAMAQGFFVPLFFVVSGSKIDISAIGQRPLMLIGFIALLMLVRFLPILIDLRLCKDTRQMAWGSRVGVAFYCTTALPIIVAVTSVAVDAGAMEQSVAGVLVAAGAITVLIMPFFAMMATRFADAKPIDAAREISSHSSDWQEIVHAHFNLSKELAKEREAVEMEMARKAVIKRHDEAEEKRAKAWEAINRHHDNAKKLREDYSEGRKQELDRMHEEFKAIKNQSLIDFDLHEEITENPKE